MVCTAERGLCGAFNSSIVRLAREQIAALTGEGKTVKILCVGRKGADQLRRQYDRADRRGDRAARVQARSASSTPRKSPPRSSTLYEQGEFDVATLFFSRFKSVIAQIPTALQIIPPVFEKPDRRHRGSRSTNTSRTSWTS